ncbi:hypothetical protein ASG37_12650 [Sphingomonas sp. Leaf407]|uniref:hypothetical protein n=1 Tax=unclassified Sphingomonas TaxID=196159 RepID=UPI0006F82C83|nr:MULTISPECIES: hypothetical protein [unclassified Sphingomonas]KQN36457.1 hypothetical protein ASE97_11905 [Sphingomonas sp. Leaf42]KQT27077.1 hypothetical protein ASG37_12650 [Sphingomonas sp. Leaf407]
MDEAITGPRCPICGNDRWHARALPECTHCGLAVADLRFDAVALREAIRAHLVGGAATGFTLAPHARRNAAWALGMIWEAERWHPTTPRSPDVTLGIIARAGDSDTVAAMLAALRPRFPKAIVVLDGTIGDAATLAMQARGVQVMAHPLGGDFAAQRNRVQALAEGWVLHLDTDERPDDALLGALGWLTAAADRDGLCALGLARRNLVDGVQSALWPDIQYRLVRSDIRFAGRVHERPDVPFERTSLALTGAIDHRLDRTRVLARSKVYEAMSAGAGRPTDEAALLRPFTAAT